MSIAQKKEEHFKIFEEKKEGETALVSQKEEQDKRPITQILSENLIKIYGQIWSDKEKSEAISLLNFYLSKAREDLKSGLWNAINASAESKASFLRCIFKAISLRLSSSPNELFYIIPRGGTLTFQLSYFGIMHFAYNAGVASIVSQPVYECDDFEIAYGSKQNCVHIPNFKERFGKQPVLYYAVVTLQSGEQLIECMSVQEIAARRARYSKTNGGFSPWADEFGADAMSRKTVLIKALKFAPKSTEIMRALKEEDFIEAEQQLQIEDEKNG